MGQKVNPIGLRVGVIRTWDSRWFSTGKQYADNIFEDFKIRKCIKELPILKRAGVAKIEIERAAGKAKVIISTARPGVVIGKKGAGIDALKDTLQKVSKGEVFVNIQEVRKPDLDANLVAQNIAMQLEKRISWRRALKKAITASVKSGVRGIKIQVSGRLDGAEIARTEWYTEKSVPLHTLRADIDYGTAEALTTYGIIGLKVWVYRGDVLTTREVEEGSSRA
jgi:small subunit ribosomal protein S3